MTFPTPKTRQEQLLPIGRTAFAIPFETTTNTATSLLSRKMLLTKVQAIAEGKDRILLTLATGTGKTAIAFKLPGNLS